MTRHHKEQRPKKRGGLLMGMRHGVQRVAGTSGEAHQPPSKLRTWLLNIGTGVIVLIAAAMLLRRCGVINF